MSNEPGARMFAALLSSSAKVGEIKDLIEIIVGGTGKILVKRQR